MTLSLLCMPPALLLQGTDLDATLKWILLSAVVLCLIVLGLQFFKNLFYAVTAPTYALRNMGTDDSLFFSILQVFTGGLFISYFAMLQQEYISNSFYSWAQGQVGTALAGYSNATYKQIVVDEGVNRMTQVFDLAWNGVIWLPVIWVVLWVVLSILFWGTSKVFFGNQSGAKVMASTLAYFFVLTGLIGGYFMMHILGSTFAGTMTSPAAIDLVGMLILAAALVYLIVCIAQGCDISGVQAAIVFIIWAAILGGGIYALVTYQIKPIYDGFLGRLSSSNYVSSGGG